MASQRELVPITDGALLNQLAETEDMSKALIKQCFMRGPGGSIFIKRAGLLYKTEKKFKGVGYSVLTEMPSEDELKRLRSMLGLREEDPGVIMKGIVRAGDQVYTDFGTATPENTNSTTRAYLLEMACTRATNRAMRIATICGFTSTEELPPANGGRPIPPIPKPPGPGHPEHHADLDMLEDPHEDEDTEPSNGNERLSDEDYDAFRRELIELRGIAPWHLMNHLKKNYGLQTMSQVTYAIEEEIMALADKGHFNKE